jgi:hypothetical protein
MAGKYFTEKKNNGNLGHRALKERRNPKKLS